jgi:hypothetical protein
MKTLFLLMAQFDGRSLISLEEVCETMFAPMKFSTFATKVNAGEIPLPVTRLDPKSQKGPRYVHLGDLAEYVDRRREAAQVELAALRGSGGSRSAYGQPPQQELPKRFRGQTDASYKWTLAMWRERQAGV